MSFDVIRYVDPRFFLCGACVVKCQTKVVALLLLSLVALIAGAQSSTVDQNSAHQTQAREYWVDPSTGLIWAARDNDRDLIWHKAMKYCRDLHLAGYSDWRLPTLAELEGIYDKDANAPGLGVYEIEPTTWHVKGNLFLTAYEWSSNYRMDDRGHPNGYAYYFDFNAGKPHDDQVGYSTYRHALCVRGSTK